jgi:hypothetical protein
VRIPQDAVEEFLCRNTVSENSKDDFPPKCRTQGRPPEVKEQVFGLEKQILRAGNSD